jgi:hypothetical protein
MFINRCISILLVYYIAFVERVSLFPTKKPSDRVLHEQQSFWKPLTYLAHASGYQDDVCTVTVAVITIFLKMFPLFGL